jgi:hypothetical protein
MMEKQVHTERLTTLPTIPNNSDFGGWFYKLTCGVGVKIAAPGFCRINPLALWQHTDSECVASVQHPQLRRKYTKRRKQSQGIFLLFGNNKRET